MSKIQIKNFRGCKYLILLFKWVMCPLFNNLLTSLVNSCQLPLVFDYKNSRSDWKQWKSHLVQKRLTIKLKPKVNLRPWSSVRTGWTALSGLEVRCCLKWWGLGIFGSSSQSVLLPQYSMMEKVLHLPSSLTFIYGHKLWIMAKKQWDSGYRQLKWNAGLSLRNMEKKSWSSTAKITNYNGHLVKQG